MRIKYYIIALITMLTTLSCSMNDDTQVAKTGYLSLEDISIKAAGTVSVTTKAVDAALAVEILKEDGTSVVKFGAGAPEASKKIELEAGDYVIKAYSSNYGSEWGNSDKGEPVYYKEQVFTIEPEKVNYLSVKVPVICTGVTLVLPADFTQCFKEYTFNVICGERNVSLQKDETAYFLSSQEESLNIGYTLTAVNVDGEEFSQNGSLNATIGSIYELTYSIGNQTIKASATSSEL